MNRLMIIAVLSLLAGQLAAQDITKQIASLEDDFKAFKYQRVIQKGNFLLADPYTTHQDSLTIYQYMLSAAYAQNDSLTASSIISHLLATQPDFNLDPRNVSPKIVEFFNLIKKNQLPGPVHQSADTTQSEPYLSSQRPFTLLVSSLIFPGSVHLIEKQNPRGYYYSAVSAGIAGGAIYYWFAARSARNDYLNAGPGTDFDRLYREYNRNYKARNVMAVSYALWSLYCLYDLQSGPVISPFINPRTQAKGLQFSFRW